MAIIRAQQAKQMLREGGRTGFFSAGLAAGDDISPGTSTSGGSRNTSSDDGPSPRDLAMGAGGKQKKGTVTDLKELQKATGTDFSGGPDRSRTNFLQNRNQQNIVSYYKNLAEIDANKN